MSENTISKPNYVPKQKRMDEEESKKSKVLKILLDWLIAFVIAFIIFFIISSTIKPGRVNGESMYPTYNDGERVFVQRMFYNINRGDVITFWADKSSDSTDANIFNKIGTIFNSVVFQQSDIENKELHIKRVVGIPGDEIEVKTRIINSVDADFMTEVYVNGEVVAASTQEITENISLTLGEDEYFVIGDNYDNSLDSRYHGPVQKEDIFGKIINGKSNARKLEDTPGYEALESSEGSDNTEEVV